MTFHNGNPALARSLEDDQCSRATAADLHVFRADEQLDLPNECVRAGSGAESRPIANVTLGEMPHPPGTIVFVDTEALPSAHEKQSRGLDGFVPVGSRVIFLRRQSPTLRAAELEGGPYPMMLAAVIWHEMAHAEGLDERQAQLREEDLWKQFVQRGLVDSDVGLTYLNELRQRR